MSSPRACLIRAIAKVVVLSPALVLCAPPATAQNGSGNYIFLVAAGFVCDTGDPSACSAAAKSTEGDSYEMSGAGTFDAQSKSVKAAGTFSHKSSNGNLLETGVWVANELVSFNSYGIAPGELMRQGAAFGLAPFAPRRLPMSTRPMPTGGLAVFRIRLLPMRGPSRTAVLQVNCALGDAPPERSAEGIRLKLEKNGPEFSEEVGGRVMFLLMPPEATAPVKTPQREAAPASPRTPNN